ncbi:MAG: pilus assembly protein PilY [Candidatus Saccharibacteria bacterium]|nr:pilus assembly protein PilY [Rhodoferax sp.]
MKNFIRRLLAVVAILVHAPVFAEDIDLFISASASSTDVPNVLIILDNTANWNTPINGTTRFAQEKAALAATVASLPVNANGSAKFNVGIMLFGESPVKGGYVRAAIRPLNSSNKIIYTNLINSLDNNSDKGANALYGYSMAEAYRYFSGMPEYVGADEPKRDYLGNITGTAQSKAVYAIAGNAFTLSTSKVYTPPSLGLCVKNFIIFLSNGKVDNSDNDGTAPSSQCPSNLKSCTAKDLLKISGGNTVDIPINPTGESTNMANEWARFMKETPALGITTYAVDIGPTDADHTALLKSMASVSSGKYFSTAADTSEISNALNNIFSEIQSVNSVFTSVSLPLSVNTQGTLLNQVFVGMFRPDPDANPRWAGNLKQYKIGAVGSGVQLQDADGNNAVNSLTGFITECARSFWTPSTVDTAWSSSPRGDCLAVANSRISNYPDGNIVEKGAQAYKLRSTIARTVKTCNPTSLINPIMASCTTLTDFSNVTADMLGVTTSAERDALINWATGLDTKDENINGVTTAETRLSVHGDVLHSRPVAINFGTAQTPQVVVFYGGNDGMLRAVNGNQTAAIGSFAAGSELWSFVPPEFYTKIKRLYDNTTPISFPNGPIGGAAKPYGIDGPITSFKGDIGGVSKTFIYASMRRGGRALYGFDVTNSLTAPSSPTLKWKIGCPNAANDTDCTTGMSGIGQTWSPPQTLLATGYGSGASPLLIMGGGYDNCEDTDVLLAGGANHSCTILSKGKKVFVVNADTGAVVKTFDTDRGVVAEQLVVSDSAGRAKYAYTADLGGNVYRMTFGALSPANWTIQKIASLGCDTTAPCTANRKFMFVPSVVANGDVYTILLGSGDREKPISYYAATKSVTNYFFSLTDKPTVSAAVWPGNADCGAFIICKNSLLGITTSATPSAADLANKKGWYLGLASTEQVVTSALTAFDAVVFSTHQPAVPVAGSCSNLGTPRVYNVGFTNGSSTNGTTDRFAVIPGTIGLAPDPTGGVITVDGIDRVVCFSCGGSTILSPKLLTGRAASSAAKGRLYWYIQK